MTRPDRLCRLVAAGALAVTLCATPALAQDSDPFDQAEEGLREIMIVLQLMLAAIPQYEVPEVLENGDILIRRVQPVDPEDSNDDGVDETAI